MAITGRIVLAALALVALAGSAAARDQIRIVGSSTVYPFTTAVAERFGKAGKFKTPVVESTGTGGGLKLFCAGVGDAHPDVANASRRIAASEFADCTKNGVSMSEIKLGFDGIVLAGAKSAPPLKVTLAQLFLALAKEVPQGARRIANPYRSWNQIDRSLPAKRIEVLGPPPTSGTRDSFLELVMQVGCAGLPGAQELGFAGGGCHTIREDGAFIEAGENDNLIVQKLEANKDAYGIFGYSFLEQNGDRLRGAAINGVAPSFETIATGQYPVARALYLYVKKPHVGLVPGLPEFIAELTAEKTFGEDGYLSDKGLVPLPAAERASVRAAAKALTPLAL